eukprot:TRINITY_DN6854_c0_g1_i2.p1 TRINITY_DN6854_c0_g1~~TRINITY_DN6854_c0_g1_i2.p1  ORF type:complete len:1127 (-),score=252.92 TRINITY_DN6854_c0_g1_i2:190-3570(-)
MFALLGHLDYIRTVQFHHTYPWIVSASDDQTIRISNWQSRTCVTVLTGHNHYVMCARFHPKEDLLVSSSLDQTLRVWDLSGLRKKTVSAGAPTTVNTVDWAGNDAIVKYVLEGHDRGVNWATFHHTLPLVASGADDRQVKLWRMNDTKAWEVDTLRGHTNNVSCVLFHPKQDLIISNSEDKSIRVWDMSKRQGVQTMRREQERFWILAAHPNLNLLAAGHDAGMIVFKLERERPAFAVHKDNLVYVRDRFLRSYSYSQQRDSSHFNIRRHSVPATNTVVRSLNYNPVENAVLLNWDTDGGTYELHHLGGDGTRKADDAKRGLGTTAVFTARNRFAYLDKNHQIIIKNLSGETTKKVAPPHASADMLFQAGTGQVLVRSDEKMTLFDLTKRRVIGSIPTSRVKYVVWNDDHTMVAMISKHALVVANKNFKQLYTVHETVRIKSGAWDSTGVFIYSNLTHIKYALPNGDSGIIRTLDVPVYITKVEAVQVHCIDREGKIKVIYIDNNEFMFKLALLQRRFDDVARILRSSKLCGQAIIQYLQRKGFPEVALHFVKDERIRLSLALECGNIDIALEAVKNLNDKDAWNRLGTEALRQGNHQVVEMAYQNTKSFERLSFLYLITGNIPKLQKMLKIAEMRKDVMSMFQNTLYLGDVEARVQLFQSVGQSSLAYLTAKVHGLTDLVEQLSPSVSDAVKGLAVPTNPVYFQPSPPVYIPEETNWPLLTVSKGFFDGGTASALDDSTLDDDIGDVGAGGWGGDDLDLDGIDGDGGAPDAGDASGADSEDGGGGWDLDDDLDLPSMPTVSGVGGAALNADYYVAPTKGTPISEAWGRSNLAGDHAAAGSFETAMRLLQVSIGAVNFAPLKPIFMTQYMGSRTMTPGLPGTRPVTNGINRGDDKKDALPQLAVNLPRLIDSLKVAYKSMTSGKFNDSLAQFSEILHSIPCVVVETRQDVNEIKELVVICREYITALRLELKRKEVNASNPVRGAELAALFTHCQLKPGHLMLSLQSAMMCCYKIKNLVTCATFARRLLELNPKPEMSERARKVLQVCEQNPSDANKLNYDPKNPFLICAHSLEPIFRGSSLERCPFCAAPVKTEHKGVLCPTCTISKIGAEATGLVVSASQQQGR